jgi:uncharacterized protein YjdB
MVKKLAKNNWKKVLAIVCCAIFTVCIVTGFYKPEDVKAATVGQTLTQPESGWQRIDGNDSKIISKGTTLSGINTNLYYNGTNILHNGSNPGSFYFKFSGTKLRIIDTAYPDRATKINIKIDNNVEVYSENYSGFSYMIVYEKLNLPNTVHTVEIYTQAGDTTTFGLDALDIDDTGFLVDTTATLATGITLNKTSVDMHVGDEQSLTATISPVGVANKNVTWSSSDSSIVSVDPSTGKVTALKEGSAKVIATTQDGTKLSTECLINVKPILVTGISLDKTSLDMNVNDENTLTATVLPTDAKNKNIKWSSSDNTIVNVDPDTGKIKALKEGSAKITATAQDGTNLSADCVINVKNPNAGNGLLTVTLTNGQQRTYDLTKAQIDSFITWYKNKANGQGDSIYQFSKNPSSAAYSKRTEYLTFEKISNFDVDEYKALN